MTIGVFKVTERSEVTIPKTPNSFFFFFVLHFSFFWLFSLLRSSWQSLSVDVKVNRNLLMLLIITFCFLVPVCKYCTSALSLEAQQQLK